MPTYLFMPQALPIPYQYLLLLRLYNVPQRELQGDEKDELPRPYAYVDVKDHKGLILIPSP